MTRILILTAAILFALITSRPVAAADLKVLIVGAQNAKGQFIAALFDSPGSWMKSPTDTRIAPISNGGAALARFDVPAGTYGLAIYHDANSDGEINTGFLGLPTESFGFSNNSTALFGPPGFGKVGFQVTPGGNMITIRLDHIDEAG